MGLLTVAAMLPTDWEKKLVDMTIEDLDDSDILWADYVFISGMYIQKKFAISVVERCRSLGTKTVVGGPLVAPGLEGFEDVDHIVLGEAEVTLSGFLEDLKEGKAGRIYKSDKRADMADTPLPLWEIADMSKYASMPIQYSRGCPFACDFCDITQLFGNKMRTKSADQMLAELEALYSRGWTDMVFVVDDNFIGNKRHLKTEVLPAMIDWMAKRDYPFQFNTQVSINLADDDELMGQMVDAGFETVFVGIETPHEDSLAECGKSQNTNRDLTAAVEKIQKAGLQVQAGFILGFDSDKSSIFETLISFIQNSGIVTAMVGLLNAPPGTKLYKRMLDENRIIKKCTGDNMDLSMNFIPRMAQQELVNGYKKVVGTIYSDKFYYKRIKTFLRNYKPAKREKRPVRFEDIKALLKSVWFLGLWSRSRMHYWKLVLWSIRRKPELLPLVITLAVHGFHFQKMFKNC